MCDVEPLHTFHGRVSVDKDSIVAARALPPRFHSTYLLTTHATNA